jgi:SAM-dependent methyltransferase
MQTILFLIRTLLSSGKENQSFIGATWVVALLKATPKRFKRQLALLLLSWSPHYFYRDINSEYQRLPFTEFLEREATRNKESREKIMRIILAPYLRSHQRIMDYGCGPGFLANAVSPHVTRVFAVDVSNGVLECARTLNGQENITYLHATQLSSIEDGSIDLVYSFAVIQHVTDQVFRSILDVSNKALREDGKIVFHVVVDWQGWQSESDWASDKSIKGKVKLKYGLNCFSRDSKSLVRMLEEHGFSSIYLQPVKSICSEDFDDICNQHLITAVKNARPNAPLISENALLGAATDSASLRL